MRQIKKNPEPDYFIAALDTVLEFEFQDEDLLTDREYVEMVIEEYNSMQEGKYAEFCSMITYCLHEYYLP